MAAPHVAFNLSRRRIITRNAQSPIAGKKSVLYWMSRDQRADDNWALIYAGELAKELGEGAIVRVVFNLVPKFLEATLRQYGFMMKGLAETEQRLRDSNIPFELLEGNPCVTLPEYVKATDPAAVVADFSPLRVPTMWVSGVGDALDNLKTPIPLFQVDAHNVVPVWVASDKQEVGARTLRPKIENRMKEYLTEFPPRPNNPSDTVMPKAVDWEAALSRLEIDRTVTEVSWLVPGPKGAMDMLESFVAERLKRYDTQRNDPNCNAASHLSPYTHFGQLSAQRAALFVKRTGGKRYGTATGSFVEESVVRRELADNFCFYQENYDNLRGAALWARESLALHASDKREYVYTRKQLETGATHDVLWNAAQIQMVREGKMHGFLRMYWAKKILEWTSSPQEALSIAIYLNDRYELDGRDPNGYVGCMWSICGVHDMGWKERPIFGKIRYMNYNGCKRKFKVADFEAKYKSAKRTASSITAFMSTAASASKRPRQVKKEE
eukprot:m.535033 g.535033  ORF g.535033 m.535033 type:complete len:496 (-) comp22062_c0_seq2:298-1785(-)